MNDLTKAERELLSQAESGKDFPLVALITAAVLGGLGSAVMLIAAFAEAPPGVTGDFGRLAHAVLLAGLYVSLIGSILERRKAVSLIRKLRSGEDPK